MQKTIETQRKALGNKINEIIFTKGYTTVKEFSTLYLGHNRKSSYISQLINGKNVKFDTLAKLIYTLQITPTSLFTFNGKFNAKSSTQIYTYSTDELSTRILKTFAENIRAIRKRKKLDQTKVELAALIGEAKLSLYEAGAEKPEFDTICKIAHALDVGVWELFDYNGKMPK